MARNVDGKITSFCRKLFMHTASKFMIKQEFYAARKISELLMKNMRTNLVGKFKEYLIYDDIYEFLHSVYNIDVSLDILDRHAVFYDSLQQLEVLC